MPNDRPERRSDPAGRGSEDPQAPALDEVLARVREAIQARHYSPRTEDTYLMWVRRFVRFFDGRAPATMGSAEVGTFLSSLATGLQLSASTQNQAFSALLFLYREVLGRELAGIHIFSSFHSHLFFIHYILFNSRSESLIALCAPCPSKSTYVLR